MRILIEIYRVDGKRHQKMIKSEKEIMCIPDLGTLLEKLIWWWDEEAKKQ